MYKTFIRPILFRLDAEDAHNLAQRAFLFSPGILGGRFTYQAANLSVQLAGNNLSNPIGLAAGFDKNGRWGSAASQLGFGFSEIGSVSLKSHSGNQRPRLFRLPKDQALINRMGLNSDGAEAVRARLSRDCRDLPLAINIVKTNDASLVGDLAIDDIDKCFAKLKDLMPIFVAVNVSCPNTEEGCLAEIEMIAKTLSRIDKANSARLPVFLKLSPDSEPEFIETVVQSATAHGARGFICGNTSTRRSDLLTSAERLKAIGQGGLSGRPLKASALRLSRQVYSLLTKDQQIIGCGGITSGADVLEFILAGCTAVELYSSLVYEGPSTVANILKELSRLLKERNVNIKDIVGSGV